MTQFRIRSFHPGLLTDEDAMALSHPAFRLLMGLWSISDDHGVFLWKPLEIKAKVLPCHNEQVSELLQELAQNRWIARQTVDGKTLGFCRNFGLWQKPRRRVFVHKFPEKWLRFVGYQDWQTPLELKDGSDGQSEDLTQDMFVSPRQLLSAIEHANGEDRRTEADLNSENDGQSDDLSGDEPDIPGNGVRQSANLTHDLSDRAEVKSGFNPQKSDLNPPSRVGKGSSRVEEPPPIVPPHRGDAGGVVKKNGSKQPTGTVLDPAVAADWQKFKAVYPRRPGDPEIPGLEVFARLRKSGVLPEISDLVSRTARYASHVRGTGEKVPFMAKFLEEFRWQGWDPPQPVAPPQHRPDWADADPEFSRVKAMMTPAEWQKCFATAIIDDAGMVFVDSFVFDHVDIHWSDRLTKLLGRPVEIRPRRDVPPIGRTAETHPPQVRRAPPATTRSQWQARVQTWRDDRFWDTDNWGPSPISAGCRVPRELLTSADTADPDDSPDAGGGVSGHA